MEKRSKNSTEESMNGEKLKIRREDLMKLRGKCHDAQEKKAVKNFSRFSFQIG